MADEPIKGTAAPKPGRRAVINQVSVTGDPQAAAVWIEKARLAVANAREMLKPTNEPPRGK